MSEQAQGHGHGAPRQNVENSHFCLVADSEEAFVLRAATARLAVGAGGGTMAPPPKPACGPVT